MTGLNGTEILYVLGKVSSTGFPAGVQELTTTGAIAALAGASGIVNQTIVASGTTNTATQTGIFIGWNSSSTGNKTQTIPASTGGLGTITVSDLKGNAGTYSITVVPVSGSIIGPASVYTAYGSITLLDTQAGWCSI